MRGWERIPDEDLWEDGELNRPSLMAKIFNHVVVIGDWKLMRRSAKWKRKQPKSTIDIID